MDSQTRNIGGIFVQNPIGGCLIIDFSLFQNSSAEAISIGIADGVLFDAENREVHSKK